MRRVIFDICLLLSIFLLPWWVTAVVAFAGIFIFEQYYEFLVAFLMIYALFAVPSSRIIASPYWFAVIISAVYMAVQAARSAIIFYK